MANNSNKEGEKVESLPNLDELLQCPVCYEIPSGQIYQCSEGHHICVRCKSRLDMCPVCRSLFFGTRNYAMEELIANVKKLQSFKLGGKITTSSSSETNSKVDDATVEAENDEDINVIVINSRNHRPPPPCKGLFRCLCCKNGEVVRLPAARMLNHLRYFHSSDLIEGRSENREYVQLWQFPTAQGRIVTALRVIDMGIFFLIIEIEDNVIWSWLTMASGPWISDEFLYTITISGNDREAIFTDRVSSVRACDGRLKKRGNCLKITGNNVVALTVLEDINAKLSLRYSPVNYTTSINQVPPQTVLRVATRGITQQTENRQRIIPQQEQDTMYQMVTGIEGGDIEPLNARPLVVVLREHLSNLSNNHQASTSAVPSPEDSVPMSRNARRRMQKRLRALNGSIQDQSSHTINSSVSSLQQQLISNNATHGSSSSQHQLLNNNSREDSNSLQHQLINNNSRQSSNNLQRQLNNVSSMNRMISNLTNTDQATNRLNTQSAEQSTSGLSNGRAGNNQARKKKSKRRN